MEQKRDRLDAAHSFKTVPWEILIFQIDCKRHA